MPLGTKMKEPKGDWSQPHKTNLMVLSGTHVLDKVPHQFNNSIPHGYFHLGTGGLEINLGAVGYAFDEHDPTMAGLTLVQRSL